MAATVLGVLFIFFARVVDVSMATIRTLMIVRGKRLYAALIGFFEVTIYILALSRVVNSLDSPVNLLFYALGFSAGNYLGSFLEEKLAMGNISAQVIPSGHSREMAAILREEDYGVTEMEGMGREGVKNVLIISLKRKELPGMLALIEEVDEDCFVTIMDARTTRGGYFKPRRKAK
ncbi:MAG: DUF2179 domain-containing protein [Halanaerobium sp.]|nr:DUF2179 domain-containing protein [Halanaerobium sp.]